MLIDGIRTNHLNHHLQRFIDLYNIYTYISTTTLCFNFRIAGGIGAVLPWIPIKAFRPCPNFIDRGGMYERAGQGLDEIAFGRDSTFIK